MDYIVAGYNMLTDIYYADGSTVLNTPGGSFYSASGVKYWRDSVAYVGTAGPDFDENYLEWFENNKIECLVKKCLPHTLKYTLNYRPDGIWSEECTYGEEYETMAKDIGRITPAMLGEAIDSNTKGIYIEASLSAKIADNFKEVKALIPNGILMWEINGDDLRNPEAKAAINERIAQVDAFSLNFDEATGFFGTDDKDAILKGLSSYNKPCFFRMGELGAGMINGEKIVFAPSSGVDRSVDPTGCGNCSTAAAMIGLAEELGYEETVVMANLAAAACASQFGPFPRVTEETRSEAYGELQGILDKKEFVYGKLL
ncbi:MAG: PfkB family carbohydrate kinase [Eubacteriales bacterium]|nr:PfkB family carbohydrate kinase [Eubacteriales bacterium]